MSKNGKEDDSQRKPAPKFINPYAKKKTATRNKGIGAPVKDNKSSLPSATAATLNPVEIGGNSTFSQAFSSVEDTTHFRTEAAKLKDIIDLDETYTSEERQQQREFDTKAQKDEKARLDARAHHELLQPHVLYVSTKQRGNGVLKYIRNVPYAFSKMVPDYIMSSQRCALFLSMKYHGLFPNYIHRRIAELKTDFKLRILLVLVDVEDNANIILFLNKLAVVSNMTLVLAWSEEEAARYLETYKAFDGKDATLIQRRQHTNFADQAADFLGAVRSVNKTDAAQLLSQFGSIKALVSASMDELVLCPGIGEKKVKRLYDAFHKPFSKKKKARHRQDISEKPQDTAKDDDDESSDGRSPTS